MKHGENMTKEEMMKIVFEQLAIDYNCKPSDFLSDEIIFTVAKKQDGRRAMPFVLPRLEIITFGKGVVVNASRGVIKYAERKLKGKSRYEVLNSKSVYGANPYYLPNVEKIEVVQNTDFDFELTDSNIGEFYKYDGFENALQYNSKSDRPEVLLAAAKDGKKVIGIACASADSKAMWQIGVDVKEEYRGKGVAVKLVNMLTIETLKRGVVPYYTTDNSNLSSQRAAVKCGYVPAWTHSYKTRLPKIIYLLGK